MDKYEQIKKLFEAAELIQEVIKHAEPDFADELNAIYNDVADIADQIEEE